MTATVPEAPETQTKEEIKEVSPVPAVTSNFELWETPLRPELAR